MKKPILDVCDLSVSRSGKVIIKDVCLTVNEGEFVAIVGPNGSGKSTFLLAILGLLKPRTGTIEIYGHPPMSRKLHRKIGWVSQAASYLPKNIKITVRELVRLGTIHLGNMFDLTWLDKGREAKVTQAIRMAGLESLQHTPIARLSGGQRQRLAIARALLRNSSIYLFDEATSALDSHSAGLIRMVYDEIKGQKTLVVISHDLSTLTNANKIYVFDNGSLVESGTHTELIDKKYYSKLVNK